MISCARTDDGCAEWQKRKNLRAALFLYVFRIFFFAFLNAQGRHRTLCLRRKFYGSVRRRALIRQHLKSYHL